jgi:hypothetical protein
MMRTFARGLCAAGALGLAAVLVPAAPAQDKQKLHRVEIIEGDQTRVRFVPLGPPSAADQAKLRQQENADQEAALRREEVEVERSRNWALRNFYNYSALSSIGFFPATVITSTENGASMSSLYGYGFGSDYGYNYGFGPWGGRWGNSGFWWDGYYRHPYFVQGLTTIPPTSPALAGSWQRRAVESKK